MAQPNSRSFAHGYDGDFPAYVPVAQRRKDAQNEAAKLRQKGRTLAPVAIVGRKIAKTFWGAGWCDHLESHSDYANRLPRGRTYVRRGAVIDLQITAGKVTALVHGTSTYTITITIAKLDSARWKAIATACTGRIGSLVELLQGKLSSSVMTVITDRAAGLFPQPRQITLDCSCPDAASMCKHVAAALYGVGARLDDRPELLFTLRGVDHTDLVQHAVSAPASKAKSKAGGGKTRMLKSDALSDIFGIELSDAPVRRRPARKE